MKKSVADARQRALENSEAAPDILIRVMDKPHKHAVVCSHPMVYQTYRTRRHLASSCTQ